MRNPSTKTLDNGRFWALVNARFEHQPEARVFSVFDFPKWETERCTYQKYVHAIYGNLSRSAAQSDWRLWIYCTVRIEVEDFRRYYCLREREG